MAFQAECAASLDGYWIIHTCLPPYSILILWHLCFIFEVNIYVMAISPKKKREKNHLVLKINEKMRAQVVFTRSRLNISFRSIDLFCVTYLGPFFVIKRENATVSWRPSPSWVSQSVYVWGCFCLCVYTCACLCVANEWGAVMMKRGWSCTLRKIYTVLVICVCVCL